MADIYHDNRGYVGSVWRRDGYFKSFDWVEDRVSVSHKGVVRGFHGDDVTWKLVSCLAGKIRLIVYYPFSESKYDLILTPDDSPILIPPKTLNAHQCLSDKCVLFYKWTEYYNLANQYSVCYNDSVIDAGWQDVTEVSERDKNAPTLEKFLKGRK